MKKDITEAWLAGDEGTETPLPPLPDDDGAETAAAGIHTISAQSILPGLLADIERGVVRVSTGFDALDAHLREDGNSHGGLVVPSITVLGAEPKIGKSNIVQCIGTHIADNGGVACFFDMELGRKQWFQRMLCRRAKVGPNGIKYSTKWNDAVRWATDEIGPRLYHDTKKHTLASFRTRVEEARTAACDGVLFVAVDSLQKLPKIDSDRRQSIDLWLREFESIREDCNAVIVVVSELSRPERGDSYGRGATRYKESGDIEYTADLCLSLYRPDESAKKGTLHVEMARNGEEAGKVAEYAMVRPYFGVNEMRIGSPAAAIADGLTDYKPNPSNHD